MEEETNWVQYCQYLAWSIGVLVNRLGGEVILSQRELFEAAAMDVEFAKDGEDLIIVVKRPPDE